MYPKTKYHIKGGGSIRVLSETQEKILGSDWIDTPKFEPPIREELAVVAPIKKQEESKYKGWKL